MEMTSTVTPSGALSATQLFTRSRSTWLAGSAITMTDSYGPSGHVGAPPMRLIAISGVTNVDCMRGPVGLLTAGWVSFGSIPQSDRLRARPLA